MPSRCSWIKKGVLYLYQFTCNQNTTRQLLLYLHSRLSNTPVVRQYHVWRGGRPLTLQTTRAVIAVNGSAAPQPPNRLRTAETNQTHTVMEIHAWNN